LRGIEAELDGGLIGGLPEVGEKVADLLFAGVDDLAGGGGVDGGSHTLTKLLEAAPQLLEKGVGGQEGFGGHGLLLGGGATGGCARPPQPSFSLNVGAPERFAIAPGEAWGRGRRCNDYDSETFRRNPAGPNPAR
jgi:hypothetical protein